MGKGRKYQERKERLKNAAPPEGIGAGAPPPPVPDEPASAKVPGYLIDQARIEEDQYVDAAQLPEGYVNHLHAKELRALVTEAAARRLEALKLYEPLPVQDAFHASMARMRLARGSNRAGKTLVAAVEVARASCGADPFNRYPKSDGRFFCVGKDLLHVGQVMWRKLGRAGAFKIIRDEKTRLWRAYRPWSEYDLAYQEKVKLAPPLIPPRLIKSISWESKKDNIPTSVTLTNGWELSFFSSLGKPPQGADIDAFWLDEEVVDASWYPELTARILDRSGRGFWSATPQAGTDQLYELHELAEKQKLNGLERPTVEEFEIYLADNPHISEENKQAFADTLSPEEQRVRIGGDFAMNQYLVYPEFSMKLHGVDAEIDGRPWEESTLNWTRYMVVDPGHQICAALFAAVPPKELGDFVYLEDELYVLQCNAGLFAEKVAEKVQGKTFQAFLMDARMAIQTEMGVGKTVQQQYSEALFARKVSSVSTRNQFFLASDNVPAGVTAVHEMLRIRQDGTTRVRVLRDRLPNFGWEVKRYHNKKIAGIVTDRPEDRRRTHLMACLRYLAMFNPRYVKPPERKPAPSGAYLSLLKKRARERKEEGTQMVRLGPGSSPWTR